MDARDNLVAFGIEGGKSVSSCFLVRAVLPMAITTNVQDSSTVSCSDFLDTETFTPTEFIEILPGLLKVIEGSIHLIDKQVRDINLHRMLLILVL